MGRNAGSELKRVLIVDDDPDWREFLRMALADLGYEAIEAADGEQALAALDRESVDVVLLDLNMPGMRGEEVVARIPQDGPQVVFLTGAGADVVGSALLSGPHYYLPKGASRGELSLLLDSLHA